MRTNSRQKVYLIFVFVNFSKGCLKIFNFCASFALVFALDFIAMICYDTSLHDIRLSV